MSACGAGCLIKVPIITDTFVGRSVAWWRRSWADFIWFRWDIISPTLTVKHASGDPSTFCWTPLAQTPYLSWAQLNRPLAELGHVFLYHLATSRWMASHPSVHSDHKAFSPIKRSILSFKYSVKKLTEMTGLEALKDVWINLEAFLLSAMQTSDKWSSSAKGLVRVLLSRRKTSPRLKQLSVKIWELTRLLLCSHLPWGKYLLPWSCWGHVVSHAKTKIVLF